MLVVAFALLVLPVVLGAYAYVLYPALLRVMPRRQPPAAASAPDAVVTIVLPVYNEEAQVRGAVEALLAQDYPRALRQILVVSDASSDRTDDIVREYEAAGVELLRVPVRGGKTAAENASLPRIRGDIVVNTDASVRLHPSAVRLLVEAMRDPSVGVASTRDISVSRVSAARSSEGDYVGYEMAVRGLETRCGGIVGASGSGYAIRMALHRGPVRADLSRDFSSALTAQRHGLRAISVDGAICYVPRADSLRREYKRKVRTISRGMETLYFNRDLLNPLRHGAFAWKLLSHKLCRWLFPISFVPALVGLALLAVVQPWAVGLLVAAVALGALALLASNWPDERAVPAWLPASLLGALSANMAVVHSAWRFFHGHEDHVWEPTRRTATIS